LAAGHVRKSGSHTATTRPVCEYPIPAFLCVGRRRRRGFPDNPNPAEPASEPVDQFGRSNQGNGRRRCIRSDLRVPNARFRWTICCHCIGYRGAPAGSHRRLDYRGMGPIGFATGRSISYSLTAFGDLFWCRTPGGRMERVAHVRNFPIRAQRIDPSAAHGHEVTLDVRFVPIASSGCDPSQSHKPTFLIAVGRLWDLWPLQYAATFAEFFCRRS
jgi:hypothetical protein